MSQLWKEWEQLEPGCVAIVEGMGAGRNTVVSLLCKEWEQLEPGLCRNRGRNGSREEHGCIFVV